MAVEATTFPFNVQEFTMDTSWLTLEEVGAYTRLLCLAWADTPVGSLPDNDDLLARMLLVNVAKWQEMKPAVMRLFKLGADGRWHHQGLRTAFERLRQRSRAAQESVSYRKDRNFNERKSNVDRTKKNADSTDVRDEKHAEKTDNAVDINKYIYISTPETKESNNLSTQSADFSAKQQPTSKAEPKAKTSPAKKEPPSPPYFLAVFSAAFREYYGTKFAQQAKDYAQLKTARKVQGEITQADWEIAVKNYFATPRSGHTMADLAANYATFHRHALDKYGKPVITTPTIAAGTGEFVDGATLKRQIDEIARREREARNAAKSTCEVTDTSQSASTPVDPGTRGDGAGCVANSVASNPGRRVAEPPSLRALHKGPAAIQQADQS